MNRRKSAPTSVPLLTTRIECDAVPIGPLTPDARALPLAAAPPRPAPPRPPRARPVRHALEQAGAGWRLRSGGVLYRPFYGDETRTLCEAHGDHSHVTGTMRWSAGLLLLLLLLLLGGLAACLGTVIQ